MNAGPAHGTSGMARRTFLVAGVAAGTVAATTGTSSAAGWQPVTDPFTLGVASGDPSPDGFVLWTRLAVAPLNDDGLGGMPDEAVPVEWQLASDERFRSIVRSGTAAALPEYAHSLHLEMSGLRPGRWYWYRFRAGSYVSPVGRTRTAPAANTMPRALTMAFASCASYPDGHFTAYGGMADDEPDLILHLGDYIYEYPHDPAHVRYVYGPETTTLANYRQRYAQYHADPDLQAAHAAAPWVVVWDDHEVDNNWAGLVPQDPQNQPPDFWLGRREAAARAYWENLPFRRSAFPNGIDMQVYRRFSWGRLARFHMLDTRQFRDDQGCGDGYRADCPASIDPARSILGAQQEAWLIDGFNNSQARWDILGQQVYFGQRDSDAGPVHNTSMDAWDGYVASRRRITQGWMEAGVRNAVVLTGDVHANWATDLKWDYDDPTGPTVGSEFVCTSVASGGDGFDVTPSDHPFLRINPHLRFFNALRGYIRTTVTPDQTQADYQVAPYITVPGAELFTRASFVVEDGNPGLQQTYDRPPLGLRQEPSDLAEYTINQETEAYP